jgi:ribosomal protein S18 acetylase RimI-like enzyme
MQEGMMQQTTPGEPGIVVRGLRPEDLEAVIALDAKNTGRRRDEFFKLKLQQNLVESGIKISLAAELDGLFGGFLLARVYYGEFGTMEPAAVLDTIGVHPDFKQQGIGTAMMRQLRTNLKALGVPRLQTEVHWDDREVLAFFQHTGFRPAQRFCLDLDLEAVIEDGSEET